MSYDQASLFTQIVEHLRSNPAASLGVVSNVLKVSRRTVEGNVVRMSGRQFKELRHECLLVKIREILLSRPTVSIKELSFSVGFTSPRSFARAVIRTLNCTPTDLRAKYLATAPTITETSSDQFNMLNPFCGLSKN